VKLLLATIFLISTLATAHSGRTDSSGNRSTGEYHSHNSGYSTPSYSLPSYSTSIKSKQQQIDESIASFPIKKFKARGMRQNYIYQEYSSRLLLSL
jgi:hypothetical protein